MSSNEGIIQNAICQYLQLKENQGELMFWRQNNVPVYSNGRYRALPRYARYGVPDIIVIKNGLFIGLEVKDKAPQSVSQKNFEIDVLNNGGSYHIVRSVDNVIDLGL